jgi:HEAT repeat protein
MFKALKIMRLASALNRPGNAEEAYAAVLELGRCGHPKAEEVLIKALSRRDGVSRSAARELGRLGDARAVPPLVAMLENREVNKSATEALVHFGSQAVDGLLTGLKSESAVARRLAAGALGDIGDTRAVQALADVLAHDEDYGVRTAVAAALGQLKDPGAVWSLVATLKLRDETTPDRQQALSELQKAAELALHKVGDPLAKASANGTNLTAAQAVEKLEQSVKDGEVHPRLVGDLALLSEAELVAVLQELVGASEEISWAKLESREPLLPPCFQTYEQRHQAATIIGQELHRRGGIALMETVLKRDLQNYKAIRNWWTGIHD